MGVKDKLEIGLKPDAPYRKDNLPDFQKDNPDCEDAQVAGSPPEAERAREKCDEAPPPAAKGATQGKRQKAKSKKRT